MKRRYAIELTSEEKDLIFHALALHSSYVQKTDVFEERIKVGTGFDKVVQRPRLTEEQIEFVYKLNKLKNKVLTLESS